MWRKCVAAKRRRVSVTGSVTHVQTTIGGDFTTDISNPDPVTMTFSSNLTAGNLIVVTCVGSSGFSIPTFAVTDSLGNTYTSRKRDTNSPLAVEVFTCINCLGGSCTVTVTQTNGGLTGISASEYTGTGISTIAIDGTSSNTGSSNSLTVTGPSVAAPPPRMLFSALGTLANSGTIVGTSGWTQRVEQDGPSAAGIQTQDYLAAATTMSPSWTWTNVKTNVGVAVSFK